MTSLELGPVRLDALDLPAFLEAARTAVALRRPSQVVTLNSLMFNAALGDEALAGVIRGAALVVPDSVGIAWAARRLAGRAVTLLPGIDLIHSLCSDAAQRGFRVFLLGSAPGVTEAAAAKLGELHPGLAVAGTQHGFFSPEDEPRVVERVRASRPDILLVGLAVPRQEKWIAARLEALGVPLVIGVGGSFDVLSGRLKRAPLWMQRCSLEWLFRTLQQPWRLKRIKDLPLFVLRVLQLSGRTVH